IRDMIALYQQTYKIKICLRGGWKANLYFFETDAYELTEKTQFLVCIHGLNQGLITIAQIGAHPDRGVSNALGRPGTLAKVLFKRSKGVVFLGRVGNHDAPT